MSVPGLEIRPGILKNVVETVALDEVLFRVLRFSRHSCLHSFFRTERADRLRALRFQLIIQNRPTI